MATKQNEYKQFGQLYSDYAIYNQELNQLMDSSGISNRARGLAKKMAIDPATLKTFNITEEPGTIAEALKRGVKLNKRKANLFAQGNLEKILNKAPKEYMDVALTTITPKTSYTGTKSRVYTKIAKLQKEVTEMIPIIQSKDLGAMKEKVKDQYKEEYSKPEEKETLEFVEALIAIDQNLIGFKYGEMFDEKRKAFADKLVGNEVGYLAANLKGKDFVEFYSDSLQKAKQIEQARQAQGQAQGQ